MAEQQDAFARQLASLTKEAATAIQRKNDAEQELRQVKQEVHSDGRPLNNRNFMNSDAF